MWIHADVANLTTIPVPGPPDIVQVTAAPPSSGTGYILNGKFVIPMPLDLDFQVDSSSYILDGAGQLDGGDVSSQGFALLLARYPQYEHIYFNPLLTPENLDELVLDQSYGIVNGYYTQYTRCQTGRPGLVDAGQMPCATAVLGVNSRTVPSRPGYLITESIDISAYTQDCDGNPVGAREFMVYWKLLEVTETHDVAGAVAGTGAGLNTPALRYVNATNDEPPFWSVWLTTDDGATWCEVHLLEPVSMCVRGTAFRLAFKNTYAAKRYLAHFAVLFRADL